MSNFHRIQWIDSMIKNKNYPTVNKISKEFEISSRQVYRDIEYMKYSLNAPIEYSKKVKGYVYSQDFDLPSIFIRQEDKELLSFLAERYSKINDDSAQNIADLFLKLSGGDSKVKDFDMPFVDIPVDILDFYNTLNDTIKMNKKIKINYHKYNSENDLRIISPYKIFKNRFNYYFVGFCHLREDIRVFRLDRVVGFEVIDEERFIYSFFDESEYKDDENSFKYTKPYTAIIKYFGDDDLNGIKCFKKIENNFYIQFESSKKLIMDLFSRNNRFIILKPNWLKRKFLKMIKGFMNEYSEDDFYE
ncbi:WYL domain-containing protein [Oceanotoga sp. DSM 15011]|uniref:helix-turn-helix transcriptional regulator n=1 Tax=Oceanotoga sp. DSM 15011 TaxID=2984951 RepID=UPI0021F4898D|nr:WYL domain-containing protein [Oceanotoga sp. DSM 15011]UYO99055.1 WYL domain-containing protein [Oceanotoga sp. DSM 15011]